MTHRTQRMEKAIGEWASKEPQNLTSLPLYACKEEASLAGVCVFKHSTLFVSSLVAISSFPLTHKAQILSGQQYIHYPIVDFQDCFVIRSDCWSSCGREMRWKSTG